LTTHRLQVPTGSIGEVVEFCQILFVCGLAMLFNSSHRSGATAKLLVAASTGALPPA